MGARKRPAQFPLVDISAQLSLAVSTLRFAEPVAYVYNPLHYAWNLHRQYLQRYGNGRKRVLFLGMNPGPWGMAQTGVPFGQIAAVADWMQLRGKVGMPSPMHPKRQIAGLACQRSEVSGARLWGLMQEKFTTPEEFFVDHFVINYCPLVFMEKSARNITPDKLARHERELLASICDVALDSMLGYFEPEIIVGVGLYAEKQARRVVAKRPIRVGRILHPSPASPAANRGWAAQAQAQLSALRIW